MGWLYGWRTRRELVNYLTNQSGLRTLKHCFVGNNMWAVHEATRTDNGKKVVFACLYLIHGPAFGRGNGNPNAWGYKDVEETMGPFQINFPMAWLDLLSPTETKYALEWRAAVKARGEKLASMRIGTFWHIGDLGVFKIIKRRSPQSVVIENNLGHVRWVSTNTLLKFERVEGWTNTSGTTITGAGSAQDASVSPSATTTAPAA